MANTIMENFQQAPTVVGLIDGGFVVTWIDNSGTLGDSSGTSIKGQLFGEDGALIGAEFLVNTEKDNFQFYPALTPLPDGGFVVAWMEWRDISAVAHSAMQAAPA